MAKGSGGAVTTVVFSPFEELNLKPDVALVPVEADKSLARYKYSDKSETAINEQIKCVRFISKSNLSTIRYFLLQLLTYLT
jgi:hypothetical protein